MTYTEEQLKALGAEEDELTEEELVLLLAILRVTLSDLEHELRVFYQKYGTDGVVTYADVKKWVSSKNHTKRLFFLNQTIAGLFEASMDEFTKAFETHLTQIISNESKFFGVKLNVDELLNTVWGVDESTWLRRLAEHRDRWTTVICNDLKVSFLKQDDIIDVIKQITKRGESIETVMKRLWRTESNAISSICRQKAYETLGIKKYKFVHVDGCSCEKCSDLHGRVFPVSEYEVGITANPLHPNCNDTTMPVTD